MRWPLNPIDLAINFIWQHIHFLHWPYSSCVSQQPVQRWLSLIILLVLVTQTQACWQEWSEQDGSAHITVYSAIPKDLVGSYLQDFQAQHPEIEVELVNEVTLSLINRLLEEQDDPQADVIWGLAVTSMLLAEWNYQLFPYNPVGMDQIATPFYDSHTPPGWVGMSVRSIVLCVNSNVLAERDLAIPDSWAALIEPAYQEQLIMPTPSRTSVGYLLIAAILQLYGETEGWIYLEQLHDNVGQYVPNVTAVCPAVAEGRYPIGISYDYRAVQQARATPYIQIVYPREGTGWEAEVNGLVRKKEVNPAAKQFLDWAISDSAMRLYAQDRSIITSNIEIPPQEGFPTDVKSLLLNQDIPWLAANRIRIQQEWASLLGDEVAEKLPE